ncbi:hypothetical protein OCK74_21840 [Chitinophagaceae bacterium LB-8]|uniref:Uncharacterized protein n=1 Tax=Paraflavisolibacter caeni TaxID=2982496 RepID=A0A9X2Y1R0_9BACT|nr:hypothetical protein [Paraflavisolibacter caeni]MCU7551778.1 hypothetical protein [Paraflavisolibacter caeni]
MKQVLVILIFISIHGFGQVYSNKEVGKKNIDLIDSLKNSEYPYVLPIWGEKAHKAGYTLPLSAGISTQYVWQESEVVIDNLHAAINDGELVDVSEFARLYNTITKLHAVNIRPDLWILPFLNFYGILAQSNPSTTTSVGIFLPDSTGNFEQVVEFQVNSANKATSVGFGITPTIGVGGGWMAWDMNFTWTDIPTLSSPAFAFVMGPRFGKSFRFKNPARNLNFWVGAFRLSLNSGTEGVFKLDEVVDTETFQAKVDQGLDALDQRYTEVEMWWNNLSESEKRNPANKARYTAANRVFDAAGKLLTGLDEAATHIEESTISYSMDKRPKDKWNFTVGAQYQINKHWMIRGEYGFLGSRNQFIGGLQYRFGL